MASSSPPIDAGMGSTTPHPSIEQTGPTSPLPSSSHREAAEPSFSRGRVGPAKGEIANSESEHEDGDSYMDSLEEGRAPLLREEDAADEEECDGVDGGVGRRLHRRAGPTDYRTGNNDLQAGTDEFGGGVRSTKRRIPRERHKTVMAFLLLFVAAVLNDFVLSIVHEELPETDPLPDFVFEHTPYWPWALAISEYLMITSFVVLLTITLCHKHRWILLRRIATVGALLYLGRCLTMFVTVVPKADPNYYCSPKLKPEERTFWNLFVRSLRVLSGLGLSIEGKHTLCGDYIYSGHTIVHVTCYLFIREYSPRKWRLLHYTSMLFSTVGVLCLLASRGHYTIDVILAYWISTRIFWTYHTMANLRILRSSHQGRNHMTKEIWFPLMTYMEKNVGRELPRRYSLPPLLDALWKPLKSRLLAIAPWNNPQH